ncbi:hypothetical protein Bca4012_035122 [Brassica carinata]|uniref:Uncharacterized protein n=1 Tax=Brassica carinata TaxID=52824 RepID=A0A8X7SJ08_BRACI|nr:hypothetical protein Bca52824_027178 [Brassica carinata]
MANDGDGWNGVQRQSLEFLEPEDCHEDFAGEMSEARDLRLPRAVTDGKPCKSKALSCISETSPSWLLLAPTQLQGDTGVIDLVSTARYG